MFGSLCVLYELWKAKCTIFKILSAVILLVMLPKASTWTTSGSCLHHFPASDEQGRYYFPSKLCLALRVLMSFSTASIFLLKKNHRSVILECSLQATRSNFQVIWTVVPYNKRDRKILSQLHTSPLFFGDNSPRESRIWKYLTFSLSSSLWLITVSCITDVEMFPSSQTR